MGMQAVAATRLLQEVLPDGVLLDPFVGGGTTLVEGLRCGRQVIGADVSPLALFASTHHTWLATDEELASLREQATEAILGVNPGFKRADDGTGSREASRGNFYQRERRQKGKGTWKAWAPLRSAVESVVGSTTPQEGPDEDAAAMCAPSPLWFCYAAAQQRD